MAVEKSFNSVEDRILKLTENLENKTEHLINHLTGGDSFFYYKVEHNVSPDNWFVLAPYYVGDYPINNLRVTFLMADSSADKYTFNLPNINKKTTLRAKVDLQLRFGNDNRYLTSIIFGADNKNWVQMIYATKRGDEVSIKTEIYLNQKLVHEEQYITSEANW